MSEEQNPQVAQSPDPITADSVVSEGHDARSAPDSSVLNERVQKMVRRDDPEPPSGGGTSPEIEALRKLLQPEQKQAEVTVDSLQSEISSLRNELNERQEAERTKQASEEIMQWVQGSEESYPILNSLGFASVVAERALNQRNMSGRFPDIAQTASEVEQELVRMAERVAPMLGYTKSEQAVGSDAKEEPINVNTTGLQVSEPPDRGNLSFDEWKEYVLSQA